MSKVKVRKADWQRDKKILAEDGWLDGAPYDEWFDSVWCFAYSTMSGVRTGNRSKRVKKLEQLLIDIIELDDE